MHVFKMPRRRYSQIKLFNSADPKLSFIVFLFVNQICLRFELVQLFVSLGKAWNCYQYVNRSAKDNQNILWNVKIKSHQTSLTMKTRLFCTCTIMKWDHTRRHLSKFFEQCIKNKKAFYDRSIAFFNKRHTVFF